MEVMKQYGDVMTMMDEFLHSIEAERTIAKQAADSLTPGPNDDIKDEPEGKDSKTIADAQAGQGAAGAEKQSDKDKAIAGVEADSAEAENKAGASEKPTDDQGPKSLDADQKVTENITMVETPEKIARAERLGNKILSIVADLQKNAAEQAPAQVPVPELLQKLAAENPELANEVATSYHNFAQGFLAGRTQRQQDASEVLASKLVKTAEEADALLDMVAADDPAAIAPPELMGEEGGAEGGAGGDIDPESAAQLDALAEEMAAAGVTAEDVVAAAQQLEELTAAGVSPEEIVAAASEVAEEDAVPPAEEPAMLDPKVAAERKQVLKNYIRGLQRA